MSSSVTRGPYGARAISPVGCDPRGLPGRRRGLPSPANLVRAAVAAFLVALGPASPVFYAVAPAAVSVNRFHVAALSAALPHVVTPRHIWS